MTTSCDEDDAASMPSGESLKEEVSGESSHQREEKNEDESSQEDEEEEGAAAVLQDTMVSQLFHNCTHEWCVGICRTTAFTESPMRRCQLKHVTARRTNK
jgi:hypothetical protein